MITIEKTEQFINGKLKQTTYFIDPKDKDTLAPRYLYLSPEEFAELKKKMAEFEM